VGAYNRAKLVNENVRLFKTKIKSVRSAHLI